MQRLITLAFVTVLTLQAQTISAADCEAALNACDVVIKKQDELLVLQANRVAELQNENEKLSAAIVKLVREEEKKTSPMVYGLGGVVLGILAGIVIQNK